MHLSSSIQLAIRQKLSEYYPIKNEWKFRPVGGGSINETYCLDDGNKRFFCKLNSATKFPQLFEKEKNGLLRLSESNIIKTPTVIDCFQLDGEQILLMKWIESGERTETFWKMFGKQLAELHQQSEAYFGLIENNYMGSVPQSNAPYSTWTRFFQQERLESLLNRCFEKHLLTRTHLQQFHIIFNNLDNIFEVEKPSLLHGDLWSGNFMCNQNSEPVLIDPAVYYGHRSMDLAMTTLFGGFHQVFYDAYRYQFPFPNNYREQWEVCNLYPLLIHLYLFGGSYLPQIERVLKSYA